MNSYYVKRPTGCAWWREVRIAWLTFLRDTSLPMSPHTPEIVRKLNQLESERKS